MFAGKALLKQSGVEYESVSSCESDKRKQKFIKKVVHAFTGEAVCVFAEYADLANKTADCALHRCKCLVTDPSKPPLIHIAGFSCKDLSKLKSMKGEQRACVLSQRQGSSGTTFDALTKYLVTHEIPIYIGENVEELANVKSDNLFYFLETMREAGYAAVVQVLNAEDYKCAAKRKRSWIIAINMKRCGLNDDAAEALAHDMMATVKRLACGASDLQAFLLKDTNQRVLDELKRRQEQTSVAQESNWQPKVMSALHKVGLSMSDCYPSLLLRASPWYATLTEREQITLGYLEKMHPAAGILDLSQDLSRPFVAEGNALMFCIVPSCKPFLKKNRRPLLGWEALRIQGLPDAVLESDPMESMSDSLCKDLAGNAFAGSVFLAVLIGVLSHMPLELFCATGSDDEADEEELLSAIQSVLDIVGTDDGGD